MVWTIASWATPTRYMHPSMLTFSGRDSEPVLLSHVAINLSLNPSLTLEEAHEELFAHQLQVSEILYKKAQQYETQSTTRKNFGSY